MGKKANVTEGEKTIVGNNEKQKEEKNKKEQKKIEKEQKVKKEQEKEKEKQDKKKENETEQEQEQEQEQEKETEEEKDKEIEPKFEKRKYDQIIEEINRENSRCYISQISSPILKKKYYKRFLKLLDYAYYAKLSANQILKSNKNLDTKKKNTLKVRFLAIGLSQVIKAIRKGNKGIVIIALDVYPVNIICHVPAVCESAKVHYTFVTTKNKLATLCKLRRSVTCLLIFKPNKEINKFEELVNQYYPKQKIHVYENLYEKFLKGVSSNHPFFKS